MESSVYVCDVNSRAPSSRSWRRRSSTSRRWKAGVATGPDGTSWSGGRTARPGHPVSLCAVRPRHVLLAIAAGLALADASIVTLALPQLLFDLSTTVEGVAAVIGVYTVVLAASLLPAERL